MKIRQRDEEKERSWRRSFAKTAFVLQRLTFRLSDPTLTGHDTHDPAAALWDSDRPQAPV